MIKINDRTAKYSDVDSTILPQTPAIHVPPALPSSPELHGRVLRGRGARAESDRRLRWDRSRPTATVGRRDHGDGAPRSRRDGGLRGGGGRLPLEDSERPARTPPGKGSQIPAML